MESKIRKSGTFNKYLFKVRFIVVLLLLTLSGKFVLSQNLWTNRSVVDSLKSGIHYTYNFEFDKAEAIDNFIKKKYPDHPATLMYEAIIMYWKYYPLQLDTEVGNKYESLILKSLSAIKDQPKIIADQQLTYFCNMMPRMMLLQYYADNGIGYKSIPHLTAIYSSIMKSFDFCKTTPEFYFPTGLYNYYIEAYPEANPFYKPFVYFFRSGNKKDGIAELYKCWQQSDYIGPEALTFLSYIYINFEDNYSEGVKYTSELVKEYPKNPLFAQYYIQLLLLNKQYSKAEPIINQFNDNSHGNNFFKNVFPVFDAIVTEHYYSDYPKAELLYKLTVATMKPYGNYGNRYISYAYFGLGRINKKKGLIEESSANISKANKFSQYPHVNFN